MTILLFNLHNAVREARPKRNTRPKPAPIPRQTRSAARKGNNPAPVNALILPIETELVETPQTITDTTATDSNIDMDIDQTPQENQPNPQPVVKPARLRIRYTVNPEPSQSTVIAPIK